MGESETLPPDHLFDSKVKSSLQQNTQQLIKKNLG